MDINPTLVRRVSPIRPSQAKVVSYYSDLVSDINSLLNLSEPEHNLVSLVDGYKLPMVIIIEGPVQTNIVNRLLVDFESVGWTMTAKDDGNGNVFLRINYKDLGECK